MKSFKTDVSSKTGKLLIGLAVLESERSSELVSFRFLQPFPEVFHGEVPMRPSDSSIVRITEAAEDLFHLWDLSLQHPLVGFWTTNWRTDYDATDLIQELGDNALAELQSRLKAKGTKK